MSIASNSEIGDQSNTLVDTVSIIVNKDKNTYLVTKEAINIVSLVAKTNSEIYNTPVIKSLFNIKTKEARIAGFEVKMGDSITLDDIVISDTRNPVTDLPFDNVVKGIFRFLPNKPVRWDHINPSDDAYALLGEAAMGGYKIDERFDLETNQNYKVVTGAVTLHAISSNHVRIIQDIVNLHASGGEIGTSFGWVESENGLFFPHEISITPYPVCETCNTNSDSCQKTGNVMVSLGSASAGCKSKDNTKHGEKNMGKDDEKIKSDSASKEFIDLSVEHREAIREIDTLKAQIVSQDQSIVSLKASNASSIELAVKEANDKLDIELASKEAERKTQVDELTTKVASLEANVYELTTAPTRVHIATVILGLKGDSASKKVEALKSKSPTELKEYMTDLEAVAKKAGSTLAPNSPIFADAASGGSPTAPSIYNMDDLNELESDEAGITEEYAMKHLADVGWKSPFTNNGGTN